jgi:hypothetical protein
VHATAQQLQAFLHFRPDQRVKGRTATQSACNRARWAHPFDSNAPSMEAQAHTSCNRRQPGASVMGQSAAGGGTTVDAAKIGPAVMAVAGGQKQRSRRRPSSRHLVGQRENPLSRREDDAPVFCSSNGSRTRNGCPANHPPRRINSAAGQAAPLAGEASDASPSP